MMADSRPCQWSPAPRPESDGPPREHLAQAGFQVLAGVRTDAAAEAVAADGIEPVRIDIADPDQIAGLARRVADDPEGRPLQALVNNAGIAVAAPVEVIPLDEWRRQFEVNLFGHIAVIQALLPALVASRGRIVNVSSIGGLVAGPTYGAYSGSKFALEAVSDALRREVRHLGVEVVLVEPGAIATPIWEKGLATAQGLTDTMTAEQRERYQQINAAASPSGPAGGARWGAAGAGRPGDHRRRHGPPSPDPLPGRPRRPDHRPAGRAAARPGDGPDGQWSARPGARTCRGSRRACGSAGSSAAPVAACGGRSWPAGPAPGTGARGTAPGSRCRRRRPAACRSARR